LLLSAGEFADTRVTFFFERDGVNDFVDVVTTLVKAAEQPQSLGYGHFLGKLRFLQLHANPFAQRAIIAAPGPTLAQQFDHSFIRWRQSLQYLNCGRLPGPIWTKQAKTLTREHLEVKSINSRHIRKPLHQPHTPQRDALSCGCRC
jgi:hypothetical protein